MYLAMKCYFHMRGINNDLRVFMMPQLTQAIESAFIFLTQGRGKIIAPIN